MAGHHNWSSLPYGKKGRQGSLRRVYRGKCHEIILKRVTWQLSRLGPMASSKPGRITVLKDASHGSHQNRSRVVIKARKLARMDCSWQG